MPPFHRTPQRKPPAKAAGLFFLLGSVTGSPVNGKCARSSHAGPGRWRVSQEYDFRHGRKLSVSCLMPHYPGPARWNQLLRAVGPTRRSIASELGASVDQTGERNAKSQIAVGMSVLRALAISAFARRRIVPKRARAQLRGRPISEKALVFLEYEEAFENSATTPFNRGV